MKHKIIISPEENLCGLACLATICAYYGIDNISLTKIKGLINKKEGINELSELRLIAEKLHFNAKEANIIKEKILSRKVKLPIIVHTLQNGMYDHFMVLFEANKESVVLGDPSFGQITLSWKEFQKIWTGRVIQLIPTESFSENKKYRRNYKFLKELISKFKFQIILMLIFTAVVAGISMISTFFYAYLIDTVLPKNNLNLMIGLIAGMSGILLLMIELNVIRERVYIKFNKLIDKELIVNIYNKITNLPVSFFEDKRTADIQARYKDVDILKSTITDVFLKIIVDICYAIWAIILLAKISWQVCVIAVVLQEVIYLAQMYYQKRIDMQTNDEIKTETDMESFIMESLDANETIKNYNSEKAMENKMKNKYQKYQNVRYKSELNTRSENGVINSINVVGQVFMLGILAILVMDERITVGNLVAAFMLISYIFAPMLTIANNKKKIVKNRAVVDRLDDVFNETTEKELDKKKQNWMEKIEEVELKNVFFKYEEKNTVLNNISFKISKGETIGIIGESGCGKTTIAKLIMGFIETNDGEILVNGQNMNNFTKNSLRKKMAYVSQNDYWFQDTIYNNLSIGKENIAKQELDKACSIVKMDEYIKRSPYGYNTIIEEGGTNLSSGQKQRLSIVKALITKPDILILDESTSNLDAQTEESIISQLGNEKERINIIIAHRLNSLIKCDKIIAIYNGNIVEAGTPSELLKQDGMFKSLWQIQNNAFGNVVN